jgi:hypothetical protein
MAPTSDDSKERILRRIRKLVKFANDGAASEAEVESYMASARRLMDEHNVEEHEALASDDDSARQTAYDSIRDEVAAEAAREFYRWEYSVAACAGYVCDCGVYWRKTRTVPGVFQGKEETHFYGLPTDVAVCKEFFMELRASLRVLARVRYGKGWTTQHRHYCEGFAARIQHRARAYKDQVGQRTAGTAIILAKDTLLRRYAADKLGINGTKRVGAGQRQSSAKSQGWSDGGNYDLGVTDRLTG